MIPRLGNTARLICKQGTRVAALHDNVNQLAKTLTIQDGHYELLSQRGRSEVNRNTR